MAIDIDQSHYSTGTATVSGVTVTGFGTTFTALRKGDQWGTHKGFGVRIAGITDDTHLTLAYDVTGLQQTAAPFEVQRTPYDIGYLQAIDELIRLMGDGALPSLAGVDGTGGDKLIKLIGPKTAVAFDGKRVINIAALTGAGVIEFDALGNALLVPKADLITGVDTDGKANTPAERNSKFGAQAAGFSVLVANIGDGRSAIYFKNTATLNDWSAAAPLTGPVGPTPTITVGTTTTMAPDRPATVTPVAVPGGVRLDFEIPRGPTGDINGVTPFWSNRLGADTTALAARAGLGLVKQTSAEDATVGSLLTFGAFGVGTVVNLVSPNLAAVRPEGRYYCNGPTNGPGGNGWLKVMDLTADYSFQTFRTVPGGIEYTNFRNNGVWEGWIRTSLEIGSTAQGRYVRDYRTRMQWCFGRVATRAVNINSTGTSNGTFFSALQTFVFPAAFISPPEVSVFPVAGNLNWIGAGSSPPTLTQATYHLMAPSTETGRSCSESIFAMGLF